MVKNLSQEYETNKACQFCNLCSINPTNSPCASYVMLFVWGMRQRRRVLSSGSNRLQCSESILSAVTTGINTYCCSGFLSLRRPLTIHCCRYVDNPPLLWNLAHCTPTILHPATQPTLLKEERETTESSEIYTKYHKQLNPRNGVLEKLFVAQLLKRLPAFYEIWKLNIVFTKTRHQSLSWARLIQSSALHPVYLRSILMLFSLPSSVEVENGGAITPLPPISSGKSE
jgi:hypothetical protein